MEKITKSAGETKALGRETAAKLTINHKPLVIALTGNLGSGKTTFVQGFAQGLGHKGRIISPTFILMRKYGNFYHIDLYRLEKNVWEEVRNLGIEDIWQEPENIVVIEWAEKIKDKIPVGTTWIKFENLGENDRKIIINH